MAKISDWAVPFQPQSMLFATVSNPGKCARIRAVPGNMFVKSLEHLDLGLAYYKHHANWQANGN